MVGVCAYAADLGLFVWLRGPGGMDPISAKALSFVAGCSVAYLGNALGTYRTRAAGVSRLQQYAVFFAVNVVGALVQLLCIAVSHYGLGFTSAAADTISGAGVGMALATMVRFWGTRTLVFGAGSRVTPVGPSTRPGASAGDGAGERPAEEEAGVRTAGARAVDGRTAGDRPAGERPVEPVN
ncbi:GtrA family protein [Streptomyces sp. SID14478]|uniref:GtrA family protein n=1 Tax=Streptomyces sp. SID14478 TaxID=2706073 RepID=UPI0019414E57|nr:GtrA family protein [Streptomyces sp. SID14478]